MCQYVRLNYGVPAEIGRRVLVNGRPGIIAADRGHYIGVSFDDDKPGVIYNCHPTEKVQYLEMGVIRSMTKAQARYRRFLEIGDCFESFRHFLDYETDRERRPEITLSRW